MAELTKENVWVFADDVPLRPWPHDYPREERVFLGLENGTFKIKVGMSADKARTLAAELMEYAKFCDEQNEVWRDIGEGDELRKAGRWTGGYGSTGA